MSKEFRLQKLLEIRTMDERFAAAKLSDVDARLNRVQEELDRINKKQSQLYASFMESIQSPGNLAQLQTQLSELKEEALNLEKMIENIKEEKAGINAIYADTLKKRKILENLKEKTLN